MQARAAYIRSIGTTGILVAAALLMLATVSALVAYEGWPGSAGGDSVTSVPVEAPRDVQVVRSVTEAPAAATKLIGREAAAASTSTEGLVRDVSAGGPSTVGLVKLPPPSAPAGPAPAPAPTPVAAVAPPPADDPRRPPRPPVAMPEPLGAPVHGIEEMAYGVLGTALPIVDHDVDDPRLGLEIGDLPLHLP